MTEQRRAKLLYLVTEDWYFWSHRLPMARAARDAGYEVIVAARESDCADKIRAEGFQFIPLKIDRAGLNPFLDIATVMDICRIYKSVKPDLVHHVAIKPVLYGSIAARVAGVDRVLNAFAGLGYLFIKKSGFANVIRFAVLRAFRWLFKRRGTHLLFQNSGDLATFQNFGITVGNRTHLIRGSGVNLTDHPQHPEPDTDVVALFVGRMLWDKGVQEIIDASRLLKSRNVYVRIVLAGRPDPENPQSVREADLNAWNDEGVVEWIGHQDDISQVWRTAHIGLLPSYREGLPKALLEGASAGRALIATDEPGCRELVQHGENGLLVPLQDAEALADAIQIMVDNPQDRKRMGQRAREIVEANFSDNMIAEKIVSLYRHILATTN